MDGLVGVWIGEWMDAWVYGGRDGWVDKWMGVWMDRWGGWLSGVDGWMDELMDGSFEAHRLQSTGGQERVQSVRPRMLPGSWMTATTFRIEGGCLCIPGWVYMSLARCMLCFS